MLAASVGGAARATPVEAVVLGVVQGLAEFFPVSSDGHRALAQLLYGSEVDGAVTAHLQLGTLAATVIVLRKRIWTALEEGVRGFRRPSLWRDTPGGRDAVFVALATLPTAVILVALARPVREWRSSLVLVGLCLLGSALAAATTRLAPRGDRATPTWTGALVVGIAQGGAAFPGLSRAGLTLAALLWLGVAAERAFELSFLASLPAVLGTIVLGGARSFHPPEEEIPAVLAGMVTAFAVGLVALPLVRRIVSRGKLHWFAFYLVPVAVATLAWGYARP